jgi:hypothetical protein
VIWVLLIPGIALGPPARPHVEVYRRERPATRRIDEPATAVMAITDSSLVTKRLTDIVTERYICYK